MTDQEIISIVEETLEVDPGTIESAETLDSLDWDSLANIGFIAAIDQTYGVSLDAQALVDSQTVADLISLVRDSATS